MSWRELLPPCLVIVAGLTGIMLLCVSTKDVPITPLRTKYGIVLDVGPSRTILFIYQWNNTNANKTRVIRDCSSCPIQGLGVSSYSGSPQKVGKSLEPCLNWAQKEIPAEQHSQTPLYLGATTSTRQLNLTHPILSDDLLAALTVALQLSPFDFQGAQILSSPKKEAFNWVAVNYVLENFFKYDWRGQLVPPRKGMEGVLSLGETSAQLTSKVEGNQALKDRVRLQLYGQTHNLYTHHCPCCSMDQLSSRLLSMLIQNQSSAKPVYNPCWPLTYTRKVQWQSVHAGPCAASNDTSDIPGPEEVFTITGSSNHTACVILVQSLLNSSNSFSFFMHSLSDVFKPLPTRFLVITEAMDFMGETIPPPGLDQEVNRFCGMSAKECKECVLSDSRDFPISLGPMETKPGGFVCSFPQLVPYEVTLTYADRASTVTFKLNNFHRLVNDSQTNLDKLADYCLVSAFIFHLSTKGYTFAFDGSVWTAFQKMGDALSGWTLGYLLSLTSTTTQDSPGSLKGIEPRVWSLLLILFVVLLTGSFTRISYRVMVKENRFSNRNSSVFDDN